MASATTTTDHRTIRHWVEQRNGHPAVVRSTTQNDQPGGLLRIDFDPPEDALERIDWDEFFETFEDNRLAFLYQDEDDSRFNKFVARQ